MDKPLLNDPNEFPSDEVIGRHLGRSKTAWDGFVASMTTMLGEGAMEWRFYRDGGAWLCKAQHKKKTVCWISVWDGFFKIGFYFTARNDADIEALPIPAELKSAYRTAESFGAMKPLSLTIRSKAALEPLAALVPYKIASNGARRPAAKPAAKPAAAGGKKRSSRAR